MLLLFKAFFENSEKFQNPFVVNIQSWRNEMLLWLLGKKHEIAVKKFSDPFFTIFDETHCKLLIAHYQQIRFYKSYISVLINFQEDSSKLMYDQSKREEKAEVFRIISTYSKSKGVKTTLRSYNCNLIRENWKRWSRRQNNWQQLFVV